MYIYIYACRHSSFSYNPNPDKMLRTALYIYGWYHIKPEIVRISEHRSTDRQSRRTINCKSEKSSKLTTLLQMISTHGLHSRKTW
jgi:hypothetical protein